MKKAKWILLWTLAGLAMVLLLGAVTMFLWNWLVPSLFNGPQIRFLEALGLLLLAKILFGGWGGGRCGTRGRAHWKHRYQEKLASMSPEARERFKERMQEKWCSPGVPAGKRENDPSNV
ncbi:MAG: hypothetical protein WA874_05265 [Chryseosolibacter sp.]